MPASRCLDTLELPLPGPPTEAAPAGGGPAGLAAVIAAAVELSDSGQRDTALERLQQCWHDLGPGRDTALARCLLAHHLAGLHTGHHPSELTWHLRALQSAQLTSDAHLAGWGMPIPARALFPLLHLRLARSYQHHGDLNSACHHLRQAHTWAAALPQDTYGHRIRTELDHLTDHLTSYTPPTGTHRADK